MSQARSIGELKPLGHESDRRKGREEHTTGDRVVAGRPLFNFGETQMSTDKTKAPRNGRPLF